MPDLKEERVQKFTTLILTLVALSFFGLFAISPTLSTIARLQKELEDNKFIDQQLKTKINNLSSLQAKYAEIENDLPFAFSAIPKNPQAPLLTAQVHAVAKQAGVVPTSFQVYQVAADSKGTGPQGYTSFLFGFSGNGNFDSIERFISSIVNIERVIAINSLSISKIEAGELKLNFKGEVYSKK